MQRYDKKDHCQAFLSKILRIVLCPECRAKEIKRIFANRIPPFIHLNDHG